MLLFVSILAATLIGAADSDSATLLGLMEAARSPVQDVYLEYEGRLSFPTLGETEHTDATGGREEYSGVFIERQDGAFFVDIYHRYVKRKHEVMRETLSMMDDRFEVYQRMIDSPRGEGTIGKAYVGQLQRLGSILAIIDRPKVLERLRDSDWVATINGTEDVDGFSCIVVDVARPIDPNFTYRYVIDMNRGGNVLRSEVRDNGSLALRTTVLRLDKFEDARKQPVWIPTQAVREAFGGITREGARTYGKEPTNRETFDVLPESVRVGSGFKDDRFSVQFKSGTPITDALKQARYDFGRNAPPDKTASNPAAAQAALEEQVQLAKAQGDELLASSRERSGDGWWGWVPWIVSLGSLSALVLVVFQARWGR